MVDINDTVYVIMDAEGRLYRSYNRLFCWARRCDAVNTLKFATMMHAEYDPVTREYVTIPVEHTWRIVQVKLTQVMS